ncbi:MAG TPA: 3'-5' exonuclease [Spirochaetales bacterium]|nr:3'-5' exonuclease [Spirochaetales bacterium]
MSPDELDGLYQTLCCSEFCAFDVETTGLSPYTERIVELGAVRFRMVQEGGQWRHEELGGYNRLVNPGIPIPAYASAIHGISDLDVSGEARFTEQSDELFNFVGDSVFVAHNAAFDMGFVREECQRAGLPCPPNPAYDTIQLAMSAVPHLPSYALQSLAKSFALDTGNAHRAYDDARTCMHIFARCVSLLYSN